MLKALENQEIHHLLTRCLRRVRCLPENMAAIGQLVIGNFKPYR